MWTKRKLHRCTELIDQLAACGHMPADRTYEARTVSLNVDVPFIDDDDETDPAEAIGELLELLGFDYEIDGEAD